MIAKTNFNIQILQFVFCLLACWVFLFFANNLDVVGKSFLERDFPIICTQPNSWGKYATCKGVFYLILLECKTTVLQHNTKNSQVKDSNILEDINCMKII